MSDIDIRQQGHAGRITLNRPKALNALTYDMIRAVDTALDVWRTDDAIKLLIIDAEGGRAFCAGGDIADLYRTGMAGDFAYGRKFWRDEYRMNTRLAEYAKPVVSFLQGFTMGGGVGVGCHASHRIVGESSRIAMPECGIGLVPDVGGSLLLANAPGHLGEYLGLTTARMGPGDAILVGFADFYLPESEWDAQKAALAESGNLDLLNGALEPAPPADLAGKRTRIGMHFSGRTLREITKRLSASDDPFAADALKKLSRNSPLSMACAVETLHRLRQGAPTIRDALDLEYRFTARAMEYGDLLEGIRAAIIDKDRNPQWRHPLDGVTAKDVARMLAPSEQETGV